MRSERSRLPAAIWLLATGAIWQGVVVIFSGVAVILSGLFGIVLYQRYPEQMSRNRAQQTQDGMLEEIAELDAQINRRAVQEWERVA